MLFHLFFRHDPSVENLPHLLGVDTASNIFCAYNFYLVVKFCQQVFNVSCFSDLLMKTFP